MPDYISIEPDEEAEEQRKRKNMKQKLAQYGRVEILSNKSKVQLQKSLFAAQSNSRQVVNYSNKEPGGAFSNN